MSAGKQCSGYFCGGPYLIIFCAFRHLLVCYASSEWIQHGYDDRQQTQPSTQYGPSFEHLHTYVNLVSLIKAIHKSLGLEGFSSIDRPSIKPAARSELKEDFIIVGQAVRLPGDINNAESLWKAPIGQRDDIMTPIPEARWDHKSFYRSPDSKNPPGPCNITLERAGFVDLAGFDHSKSSEFLQQRFSTFHPTSDFRWKLLSKLWKMPVYPLRRLRVAIWASSLLPEWTKVTLNFCSQIRVGEVCVYFFSRL
jgi:hypothetical protein